MSANLSPQIDWQQLQQLFNDTAFWAQDRPLADLQTAVLNSHPVVSAIDGDRVIGFARATSDGVYRATIWDVIVHPDYQGAGIGRKLVQTILSHPVVNKAERVYLMTTNKQQFYERIGFEVNSTTTMVLYNQPFEAVPMPLGDQQPVEPQFVEQQFAESQAGE
ncbi:MAG: GNAT family N-acetyltransferase [Cyanobacteria bacterium P01_H01_bin.121]